MNLAVRGIDADIRWNNEGSFHKDELPDLKADFILANPPFNVSDWGGDRLREDARWTFGVPPVGNANYAWLQHIHHHLAPNGTAGVVLANGSMSTATSGEGDIRRAMVEADAVDCMIALPGQLFYSTTAEGLLLSLARRSRATSSLSRPMQYLYRGSTRDFCAYGLLKSMVTFPPFAQPNFWFCAPNLLTAAFFTMSACRPDSGLRFWLVSQAHRVVTNECLQRLHFRLRSPFPLRAFNVLSPVSSAPSTTRST